jgi:uncharacterized protein (TIGR03083 family)
MPDLASAYAQTQASMTGLLTDATPETEKQTIPACPGWTVRDLIAHVSSIATALSNGDFPADLNPAAFWDADMANRREEFIDIELDKRQASSLAELISEWNQATTDVVAMIRGDKPWPATAAPLPEWILVTDLSVHHHDLRGGLGTPGDRDSLATGLALRSYVEGMRFRTMIENSPTFVIRAGSREWTIGQAEPIATVSADPFELARAASGRRSMSQLRAYDWTGDPEPVLHMFYPYGVREQDLVE